MTKIDWDEFKEYKKMSMRSDNFEILLDFMKSYYSILHPQEMYDTLAADDTASLMLSKREIKSAQGLEEFLFKR